MNAATDGCARFDGAVGGGVVALAEEAASSEIHEGCQGPKAVLRGI